MDDKPKRVNWIKRIIFLIKFTVVAVLLIAAGIVGAIIAAKVIEYNSRSKNEEFTTLQSRVDSLVLTVQELEEQNNQLIAENQGLRDKLKSEEDKLEEEKNKNKLKYETAELGKRLMTFDLQDPKLYFEFDKDYGKVSVAANSAQFSNEVVAEGIEISFEKSAIKVTIEPWKIANRSDELVETYTVKTADGKDSTVVVSKDSAGSYNITAEIIDPADSSDKVKLRIGGKATSKDELRVVNEQISSLLQSVEINFNTL